MRWARRVSWLVTALWLVSGGTTTAQPDDDDDDDAFQGLDAAPRAMPRMRAARVQADAMMGATPGGAQDIEYARDRILAGEVPHPNTFTPEGLFSQYDLPLDTGRACSQLLCLTAAATRVDLVAQPEVRFLAQLGFASSLDARTWRRAPLNLVAVVDKSGSMSGGPLDTVKHSLRRIADQLTKGDQLAIVLYGDRSHVHLPPTPASHRRAIRDAIDAITSAGSTFMEEGLKVGFGVARRGKRGFSGTTRVMLFTDERPNVGTTEAGSFMQLARAASKDGIGLTTIGVGTHFGAELATAISSVRGGNLFFFPDVVSMTERIAQDFDTMVTELAYDMRLSLRPASGYRLAGIYGVPGDMIKRIPGGGVELGVETVFLSRDKGGIFFAFARDEQGALPPAPGPLSTLELSYVQRDGARQKDRLEVHEWKQGPLPLGLARGRLLVDEVTALKRSAALHLEQNDQEGAYRLVRALRRRFEQSAVSGLEPELRTLAALDTTLTRLSGHRGEAPGAPGVARRDPVNGLPVR